MAVASAVMGAWTRFALEGVRYTEVSTPRAVPAQAETSAQRAANNIALNDRACGRP